MAWWHADLHLAHRAHLHHHPQGAAFFPALATPTGAVMIPQHTGPPGHPRALMMPRRQRTRHQDGQYRIAHERAINQARMAGDEPPPF